MRNFCLTVRSLSVYLLWADHPARTVTRSCKKKGKSSERVTGRARSHAVHPVGSFATRLCFLAALRTFAYRILIRYSTFQEHRLTGCGNAIPPSRKREEEKTARHRERPTSTGTAEVAVAVLACAYSTVLDNQKRPKARRACANKGARQADEFRGLFLSLSLSLPLLPPARQQRLNSSSCGSVRLSSALTVLLRPPCACLAS